MQKKRPWVQGERDGVAWAQQARLFPCVDGQGVEEVVESLCRELLKTQVAMVPQTPLWLPCLRKGIKAPSLERFLLLKVILRRLRLGCWRIY